MSKDNSMTPEETNYQTKSNFSLLKQLMPSITFDEANSNLFTLQQGNLGVVKDLVNEMVGSAPSNPMTQLFNSMFGNGDQSGGGGEQPPVFTPSPATPPPVAPPPPKQNTGNGWDIVQNDFDAIKWALAKGDITQQEADWLTKWQKEDANGNTNFVDGGKGTRKWDYMNSDLTDENKRTVDKFFKSVSGNWDRPPAGVHAQQPQQPVQPPMGQPPMGQPPMGQPPMGQPPMGQPPMGQPPMGQPGTPPVMQPQQPQANGPQINPNVGNLTPEQLAALTNMQGYRS